jgi:CheY-like chemotaxis protein
MAKRPEQTGEFRKLPATEQSGAREGPSTAAPIRVLLVEDRAQDAELALYQLRMHGMDYVSHRVDSEPALREALSTFQPDVVLSDFSLPGFDGLSALKVALEVAIDVPFIFVSGTIGEERAIEAVRRGAADYVLKTNLSRLSGVALYPEDGQDSSALVQNAEAALRNARTTGQRQLSYSAHQHVQDKARLALEHRLRLALERRQFELHYQPIVNVSTRRLEGVEALIRWNEPDRGLVSPNAFLPLLESTELIVEVGEWVLEQSVRDCQHWQQHHLLPAESP